MKILLSGLVVLAMATAGYGKMVTQTVQYKHKGTMQAGYLAYDDAVQGKRPGVLIIHEWWGLNDFAKQAAIRVAHLGYMALAADMYGQGKVTQDPEEARGWAGQVKGTPLMRERALAGLKVLAQNDRVDSRRLGAMGFCFGGTTVLELAYSGADLRGVVSFHGGLTAPRPEDQKNLKASILVLHGADDPTVKPEDMAAFQEAMRQAKADWQMVLFGGAVHSFTNPEADRLKIPGVAYDALTAARSYKYMELFFKEIFSLGNGAH
uniref:Dienelactone hydrolase family protein n=1 Tax=Desulfobacca acetoxidans TaxID=60893 RepID=A0A7C3V6L5_9BACT